MNDLILYTTEDGRSQIQLRADQNTVWLTQLEPSATVKESLTVQIEGGREVRRPVTLYNLDAILAVGYRVRSTLPYKPQRGVIHTARGNAPGQIRRKKTLSPERAT
jgi:hypothetical protein